MKNRNIIYIIGLMLMALVVVIMLLFRYSFTTINKELLNTKWYRYNNKSGYYDVFKLTENNFNYYKADNTNSPNEFDNCKNYKYNKMNKTFTLDCNKKIKISNYTKDKLVLELDNKTLTFFNNTDTTINYEFELAFGKSMIDYKKEKSQILETIEINEQKLLEVLKENEYSKIIFMGDKCTSVDCVLSLDIIEKNNTQTINMYYFDYLNLTEELLNKLNQIDNKFDKNLNFYNGIYPRVIIVKNNKIVDTYEIKCIGFNCNKYIINEF